MDWVEATYQPTTLFTLKPSWATSSGGKSLLFPTPYALKIALLDVAIRIDGVNRAEAAWPWLRDLQIGIQLPPQIVVTNLFAKILKLRRRSAPPGSADIGPFQRTIGYREYVYHPAPICFAFGTDAANVEILKGWLLHISYLGKRGGFFQLTTLPRVVNDLASFISLTAEMEHFPIHGIVQQVDDCSKRMKFAHANIYNKKRPKRITRHIVFPYQLVQSSRSYTIYERITEENHHSTS